MTQTISKQAFAEIFLKAINKAKDEAEKHFNLMLPAGVRVELHFKGVTNLSFADAVDKLFISDEQFFAIIDVSVKEVSGDSTLFFVRVSGHPPVSYSETWGADGMGPFHTMVPNSIQEV